MGNSDSKTVWDDKSATGGIQNTHTRQGLGGLIIYHIHDKKMRKSETNLWIGPILLDIQNNAQKEKKTEPRLSSIKLLCLGTSSSSVVL